MQDENNDFGLSRETVQKAIKAIRERLGDVNPFTVAEELRVSRSVIYRQPEIMTMIIASRSESITGDDPKASGPTWQPANSKYKKEPTMQKLDANDLQATVMSGSYSSEHSSRSNPTKAEEGVIVNFAGNDPRTIDYSRQLAHISWKDVETIYYSQGASLRDRTKKLFGNGSNFDVLNHEQNSAPQSVAEQSISYASLGKLESIGLEKQSSDSPFAKLKTNMGSTIQSPQETFLDPVVKDNPLSDRKSEVIKTEISSAFPTTKALPQAGVPVKKNSESQTVQSQPGLEFKKQSELELEKFMTQKRSGLVIEQRLFSQETPQAKSEIKVSPVPETLMQKVAELPKQLATHIRSKLASDANSHKDTTTSSHNKLEAAQEVEFPAPLSVDFETRMEMINPAQPSSDLEWRKAFETKWQPESKSEVMPEANPGQAQSETQAEEVKEGQSDLLFSWGDMSHSEPDMSLSKGLMAETQLEKKTELQEPVDLNIPVQSPPAVQSQFPFESQSPTQTRTTAQSQPPVQPQSTVQPQPSVQSEFPFESESPVQPPSSIQSLPPALDSPPPLDSPPSIASSSPQTETFPFIDLPPAVELPLPIELPPYIAPPALEPLPKQSKEQELKKKDIPLLPKPPSPESHAFIPAEPKLISLKKTKPINKAKVSSVLEGIKDRDIQHPQQPGQSEVDTSDLSPVETKKKAASPEEAQEDIAVSGDELRNLIQSHIKNAADQMAENIHGVGTGKEFEVWLNNPSRSKFIGSTKSQDPNAAVEESASPSLPNSGTFKPRIVPPEVRKSCLILGVRMDNITYEVVQSAWKKAIAAPGVHPDQGGDTELAVYLNTAKDVLMRWLDAQAPKLGKKFGSYKKEPEPKKDKDKTKDQ